VLQVLQALADISEDTVAILQRVQACRGARDSIVG
jgi:hypothetical protein